MLTTLLPLCLLLAAADKPASPFDRWEKAIAAIEKRDAAKPPPDGAIFFCGSSSIVRWPLEKSFPDRKVVNCGFGGSQLADSTHFAPRILLPYRPGAIVLYAGDNDIASGKKPEKVHEDFVAFVKAVRGKLPATPIYFIAIKPSISRWRQIEAQRKANALVEQECKKGKHLVYVDVAPAMLGKDGKPRPELFVKDGLHLSAEGYEVWARVLSEHLKMKGD